MIGLALAYCLLKGMFDTLRCRLSPEQSVLTTLFANPTCGTNPPFQARVALVRLARCILAIVSGPRVTEKASLLGVVIEKARAECALYVQSLGHKDTIIWLDPFALPNGLPVLSRVCIALLLCAWALIALPIAMITGTMSCVSRVREVAQAVLLAGAAVRIKPRSVFYFGSYDRNGNLASYLMSQAGIHVVRMCSLNPISIEYSACVCDTFVLTTPLQVEELASLAKSWFVPNILLWHPVGHVSIPAEAYENAPLGGRRIGLLSTGFWLRQTAFDFDIVDIVNTERLLWQSLREYLDRDRTASLLVLPHPLEKKPEFYERTCRVYGDAFGRERVTILRPDERTHRRFSDVDLLVAVWSTTVMEALYCGHKVLLYGGIATYEGGAWPALNKITAGNKCEFTTMMQELLALPAAEYFDRYDLARLRHTAYPKSPQRVLSNCTQVSG